MGGSNSRRRAPPSQRSTQGGVSRRGRTGSPQESEVAIASKQMQGVVSRLTQRRTYLEKKAATSKQQARKLKREGNKRQAILHLRRMKQFEKEALKLDNVIMRVEGQQLAIESAGVTSTAVGAIRTGLKTQREIANTLDPDKIAEDLDEIQDLIQDTEEVTEIMSHNYDDIDEDELLAELNDIDEGETVSNPSNSVEIRLPSPPKGELDINLPPVPAGKPKPVAETDEDALTKLEAAM
mmetsp:Transcript_34425/g.42425  ORF Transcript_34425/g.42425 Transcript_34425/m.42425 type:complete len:238 (+) Transcript_34425:351-1064(+)|eukprot:CAMPEP_0204833090 /NCGR_PEP_ID=MMETSP1346-20131115/15642_1 /ASSEMBLY_ACC=CAM_ASM_000771 /TAXON_ID=215587 /ORGANISM="Aplanochytrium stocchinoi, Strain GSBS06" /LENGTH=237 /DNA_ID=CAMNT_0051965351 /DNA_START=344 /DNA_END=1057 /DNA_ORIENTATION=-